MTDSTTPESGGPEGLRERTQEITAEYWSTRESQSERVAVAQLSLALAREEGRAALAERAAPRDADEARPCRYCGSVNGETPPSAYSWDPLTGETLRAAIAEACSLNNPRLSEVDWDDVVATLPPVAAPPTPDLREAAEAAEYAPRLSNG